MTSERGRFGLGQEPWMSHQPHRPGQLDPIRATLVQTPAECEVAWLEPAPKIPNSPKREGGPSAVLAALSGLFLF